jgi:hypothetical protein
MSGEERRKNKLDSLSIKKIIYPNKKIFIYKYKFHSSIDSIVHYKDSIKFNNQKLKFLDKKVINFKNKNLLVYKYNFSPKNEKYMINLYFNDSLGLIISDGVGYARVAREYNVLEYKELHNLIINDSLFFHFQIN